MNKTLRHSREPATSEILFDHVRGTIEINGVVREVTPRQAAVLSLLMEKRGQLVTRSELIDAVWEGNHFVGDRGLSDVVYQLRKLLSDLDPKLIKTIPRKGYILLGKTADMHAGSKKPRRIFAISAVAALLMIGVGVSWLRVANHNPGLLTLGETNPLIDAPGSHFHGDVSARGNFVAYTQSGHETPDLVIENRKTGDSTVVPGLDGWIVRWPIWLGDEERIGFLASKGKVCRLYRFNHVTQDLKLLHEGCESSGGLDWTPVGQRFVFTKRFVGPYERWSHHGRSIALLGQDGTVSQLTRPRPIEEDRQPRFGPDGTAVGFIRDSLGHHRSVWLERDLNPDTAPEQLVSSVMVTSFDWTKDGSAMLLTAHGDTHDTLYKVSLDQPEILQLTHLGTQPAANIAVSGNHAVFSLFNADQVLKAVTLDSQNPEEINPVSESFAWAPLVSPSGRYLAYVASNEGKVSLKVRDLELNLVLAEQSCPGHPRPTDWHASESRILLVCAGPTGSAAYELLIGEQRLRRVEILGPGNVIDAKWSANPRVMFGVTDLAGDFHLWRGAEGEMVERLTNYAVKSVVPDAYDPDLVFLQPMLNGNIFKLRYGEASLEMVFDSDGAATEWWDVIDGQVLAWSGDTLWSHDLSTGKNSAQTLGLKNINVMSISGDGKWLFYDQTLAWNAQRVIASLEH